MVKEIDSENASWKSVSVAFDVDGTLGRLAKWLRIMGFDAAYPCKKQSGRRIFVTSKQSRLGPTIVIVSSPDALDQLKDVLDNVGVRPDPDLFLSRCLVCNVPVTPIPREEAKGKVPEAVYQGVQSFNRCGRCQRIYWEGSHPDRIRSRLKAAGVLSE